MPSPFPGMDPWLEDPWLYADLRFTLLVRLSDALNRVLPEGYVSTISHITEEIGSTDAESFVKILAVSDKPAAHVTLTTIELPERHRGWRNCRAQRACKIGRILVRLFRDPWADPGRPSLDAQVITHRFGEMERTDIEAIDYRNPLPTLLVPWEAGKPDLEIALQPLLDETYDLGRYPLLVDYRHPCDPPLTPEQQAWAEGILRAKGLLS